ncbi:hypothetical protein BpHYR1_015099 [Brachionus plicatilis]|uniref:Uncharacterized protein n=1 Tax=Brachionus plicatilis TaxID=10195 RepID=A0A3M7RN62_BRAPC|nr:hypothetical protein BpHYR1_015099 [Brachionus plicatilis]
MWGPLKKLKKNVGFVAHLKSKRLRYVTFLFNLEKKLNELGYIFSKTHKSKMTITLLILNFFQSVKRFGKFMSLLS